MHNPDCTHGGPHAYSECRDRYAQPLKMIEPPAPAGLITDEQIAAAVRIEDEGIKLLLAAAGNVLKADEPAAPAQ